MMDATENAFSLGVEEEYLLVDKESRDLVSDPPRELMLESARRLGSQVSPELMRSQIEVGTTVCTSIQQASSEIKSLRSVIADVCDRYGYAPVAVSTHPFAHWLDQKQTEKERYADLTREMQGAARRLLICGMHVHVGLNDPDLRIDVMSQMSYFLPHLLALSCSSPFWEGANTGLKSYRLTVFDGLPRTGLPPQFKSFTDYQRHVDILQNAGLIESGSSIWWDLRPSARFPTLETRVMDVCTSVNHAVSIAALNVCVIRMLYRVRRRNMRWRVYENMLIDENRWRAMRYSFDEGMIDFGKGQIIPFDQLLAELLDMIAEDARALGCEEEINRIPDILAQGTSAHQQLHVYGRSLADGMSTDEALKQVVDWLIEETVRDL
jgi:carboxylate-amine ligase